MSFRGRGRGRGGFGGGRGFAAEKPFELFPVVDAVLPDPTTVPIDRNLILWNTRLLHYWKTSPYYLVENVEKKNQSADIERYCDLNKPKTTSTRDSIYQFLQINASNFPQELVKDSRRRQNRKRVRWNPGMKKIDDYFDKIEQKYQDQGEKDDMEKKEDEDEEDNDDEAVEEDDQEFSSDGDYNKTEDFDDDDDDFNMNDDDNGMQPTFFCISFNIC
ncbi:hypothetical protein Ddye_030541 [Dipteronia dyeriana]|uniref:DNA-directed RNA polymerase III subunit n=1 Tax=Dipteronia dyeriana TaxID=168575 RepID=A0AAD9THM3_9ROSI|nr:hypothetical protein Ddye_030541 [Dipteronia dyeriana]